MVLFLLDKIDMYYSHLATYNIKQVLNYGVLHNINMTILVMTIQKSVQLIMAG